MKNSCAPSDEGQGHPVSPVAKHTPGPWQVELGGFVGGPVGFGRICQSWNKFEEDFTNAEANARLIAAAPDIYQTLRMAVEALEHAECCRNDAEWLNSCRNISKNARAAIAKAEGRS